MMATGSVSRVEAVSVAPNRSEIVLGWAALSLLAVVLVAIGRGHAQWGQIPWTIWVHLATMILALALTPVMFWNPRGTRRHRQLGYVWVVALGSTALLTFWIRTVNHGNLSYIHLLSAFTLVQVPRIVWSARQHRHAAHRRSVRAMVIGALLVAGFFTLPFGRLLGTWLAGS